MLAWACSNPEPRAPEGKAPKPDEENAPASKDSEGTALEDQPQGGPVDSPKSEKNDPLPIPKELPESFDCSGHTCYRFAQARQALVPLLLHEKAQLIAFGEAHAPATFRDRTTVKRFTDDLLPTISDGSSHLLLELLLPPEGGCQKEKEAAQKESDQVTEGQAESNQNEYLALGKVAREQGIVPDILRASCDDLARIAAPDGGVFAMMETIATLSAESLKTRLRSTKKGRPMVLAYGGALHNDAVPRSGRESWSYGPALLDDTKGRYLEIDLVIPELIGDSESWQSFAWYDAYQALEDRSGAVLMKWGDKSYTLFFPPSPSDSAPSK